MQDEAQVGDADANPITAENVVALARTISEIDLTGVGVADVPWGEQPTAEELQQAIDSGAYGLPRAYQDAYVTPLEGNLQRILFATAADKGGDPGETLIGAVYGHAPDSGVAAPLRQFLAVVSDLYQSFLSKEKRAGLQLPLTELLPPLATFRRDGSLGPFTYTADIVNSLIGSNVGVVSIPSTYREHPVIWGSLAHETGGHDVLHADPGLMPELKAGIYNLFAGLAPQLGVPAEAGQLLGALWAYWADEAASDVCGVLNMGPAFGLNFAPWLAALRARLGQKTGPPGLLTDTIAGPGVPLDTHPTDILRIHLAIGATASLRRLNEASRGGYVGLLHQLAELLSGGAESVGLEGNLPTAGNATFPVAVSLPLPLMQYTAALVGGYVATAPLQSFQGRSLQDIETWDELDESVALRVAEGFRGKCEVGLLGEPAHLLAGATIALARDPQTYEEVNDRLAAALGQALSNDPLWASPRRDLRYAAPAPVKSGGPKKKPSVKRPSKRPRGRGAAKD